MTKTFETFISSNSVIIVIFYSVWSMCKLREMSQDKVSVIAHELADYIHREDLITFCA